MLRPVYTHNSTPERLYKELALQATNAVKNLQGFTKYMRDPTSQRVFTRANESRTQNPRDIAPWQVIKHADWLERKPEEAVKELKIDEEEQENNEPIDISTEDGLNHVRSMLLAFQAETPKVDVLFVEKLQTLEV